MALGDLMPLLAAPDVPGPVRGAALLALVVAGGAIGVLLIVLVAWSRRRRTGRRAASATPSRLGSDPWRESGRRVTVDPDDDAAWPPVDPRPPHGGDES